jgi:hypothetical protein
MADSHPTPQAPQTTPSSTPADQSHGYEGFDPELPEHDKETGKTAKVSTVQVGASAAAAVTSALAASFFGVAGTLIGAAVGSIVSTIAGALYADYLRRAGKRLRSTTTIVVQRIPPDRVATSPLRRLAEPEDPGAVPPTAALRPVEPGQADQTVVVPMSSPAEILSTPAPDPTAVVLDGSAVGRRLDETMLMPAVRPTVAGGPPTVAGGPPTVAGGPPTGGGAGNGRRSGEDGMDAKSWWRRPVVGMIAVGLAGFAIAIGVITFGEGLTGHKLSGGTGTTLGNLGGSSSVTSTSRPAPTVTVTATATPSTEESSTSEAPTQAPASSAPATTSAPESTTAAPTATSAPSSTGNAGAGSGDAGGNALGDNPTR